MQLVSELIRPHVVELRAATTQHQHRDLLPDLVRQITLRCEPRGPATRSTVIGPRDLAAQCSSLSHRGCGRQQDRDSRFSCARWFPQSGNHIEIMSETNHLGHANRPNELLAAFTQRYPNAHRDIDEMRMDKGSLGFPYWPDWCYAPIACSVAAIASHHQLCVDHMREWGVLDSMDATTLAALATWRKTRGVYSFDPDVYQEVCETSLDGKLPVDMLFRMPEWCIYLPTPGMNVLSTRIYGCFVHLEYNLNNGRAELRLLFDVGDDCQVVYPVTLHLGDWTLHEALDRANKATADRKSLKEVSGLPDAQKIKQAFEVATLAVVNMVLFVCSQASDISGRQGRPGNPTPTKTKKGMKVFAAQQSREWLVGARLGSALRKARSMRENAAIVIGRRGPRPHIRRAHWHTYRVGPRSCDGQRIPSTVSVRRSHLDFAVDAQ